MGVVLGFSKLDGRGHHIFLNHPRVYGMVVFSILEWGPGPDIPPRKIRPGVGL